MKVSGTLVATALLAALGCGGRGENALIGPEDRGPNVVVGAVGGPPTPRPGPVLTPARPADAPDRVDRDPTVSDDAQEIAEVRAEFAREVDAQFAALLERLHAGKRLYSEHRWALKHRKERAVAELQRMLDPNATVPDKAAARAAHTLIGLGDPSGERCLLDSLRSSRPTLRSAALEMLCEWDIQPDFSAPERAALALSLIDDPDPDVADAAVRLCAFRKIPGTEARLVALLQSGHARHPRSVANGLAEIAETPAAVGVMLEVLLKERPESYEQGTGYQLERLLKSPDPKVGEPVRRAFRSFALAYTGEDRYKQAVVRDLSLVADATMIPVFNDIIARAEDPVSRLYAHQALGRLQPATAVARILGIIRTEGISDMDVDALREFATEKDAGPIIAALLDKAATDDHPAPSLSVVRLLLDRLGSPGRAALETALDRLEPDARVWAFWKLKGLDLGNAIDDLHAAGVVPLAREPLLERMRHEPSMLAPPSPLDMSDPFGVWRALGHADLLTAFDTETNELPCNHHRLILEFAENTAGRFSPECAVQTWHRKGAADSTGPYTVRFLYQGRSYRFGAENRGDYYDVTAVHRALNFALKQAGQNERFLAFASNDQIASFVFADPAAFLPFAARYGIPLSEDPDEAMRKGKEFERRVIERERE